MTILKNYRFLIFLLILVVFLRVPSFFEPYSYGDEGIYLTLGEAVRQGLVLYRDIHDNKPPLLYLLAATSGSLFWFRFLLLACQLATIFLFWRLTKVLLPQKEKIQKIALFVFALLLTLPFLEGNIVNAEIFMILPILAGILRIFCGEKTKRNFFLAGLFFSLATLFKVPAAFDFAAVSVFILLFAYIGKKKNYQLLPRSGTPLRGVMTNYFLLLLGFFLPILLTVLYFWLQGALSQYLNAAFFQNLPYLSSWGGKAKVGFANWGLLLRSGLLLALLGILWRKQKAINRSLIFISLWFAFSFFAALLSERPYPHYLIQVLPSFSLLVGVLFLKFKTQEKILCSLLLGSLFFAFFYFRFWAYPVFSYYQNFLVFVSGQQNQQEYFRNFGGKVPQTYQLAEFLVNHTAPNEKVFVWGEAAPLYTLARRLPVGRYTVSYHIIDFDDYQETIEALNREKPRFIIDLNDESRPFPELKTFLSQNYLPFTKIDEASIFRLAP